MGDRRDALDVEDLDLGVGDGLAEEQLCVRLNRRAPGVEVVGVLDEGHRDPKLREGVLQQVERAAVERRGGDDVVAGLGDVEDGQGLSGLP